MEVPNTPPTSPAKSDIVDETIILSSSLSNLTGLSDLPEYSESQLLNSKMDNVTGKTKKKFSFINSMF